MIGKNALKSVDIIPFIMFCGSYFHWFYRSNCSDCSNCFKKTVIIDDLFSDIHDEPSARIALNWCGHNLTKRMITPLIQRCFHFWSLRNELIPASLHELLSRFIHCEHLIDDVRSQYFFELAQYIPFPIHHGSLYFVSELLTNYTPSNTFQKKVQEAMECQWLSGNRNTSTSNQMDDTYSRQRNDTYTRQRNDTYSQQMDDSYTQQMDSRNSRNTRNNRKPTYIDDVWHLLVLKCPSITLNIICNVLLEKGFLIENISDLVRQFKYLFMESDLSDIRIEKLKSCICRYKVQFNTYELISFVNKLLANVMVNNDRDSWDLMSCITKYTTDKSDTETVLVQAPSTVLETTDSKCHQSIADIIAFLCLHRINGKDVYIQGKYKHLFDVRSVSDEECMRFFAHLVTWV